MFPPTYNHAYHQSLVYKIFIGRKTAGAPCLTPEQALDIIEGMANLSRGLKQIVYLVGWQFDGHDSKYPAWSEVNPRFKREQDAEALNSLLWLMETARERFGTIVSLHINMDDAYPNSPLWEQYRELGLLRTDTDGSPKAGDVWDGELSYHVFKTREWKAGLAQKRIDALLKMLPPLREMGTIHIDAFRPHPPGKHEPESFEDELQSSIDTLLYWRDKGMDVTTEFFSYHELAGLLTLAWHFNGDESTRLRYPASVLCGGDAAGNLRHAVLHKMPVWAGGFLTPEAGCKYEEAWGQATAVDIRHPDEVAQFVQPFSKHVVSWYLLNREQPVKHTHTTTDYAVEFSGGTRTNVRIADRHLTLHHEGRLLVDGHAGCVPALWRENEQGPCDHIAWSRAGGTYQWQLPTEWQGIPTARILPVSPLAPCEMPCRTVPVEAGRMSLELAAGEAVWVSPVF